MVFNSDGVGVARALMTLWKSIIGVVSGLISSTESESEESEQNRQTNKQTNKTYTLESIE